MSTNTPLSQRLLAPTKAYSAKQLTATRTPSASIQSDVVTSKTPGPQRLFSQTAIEPRTPVSSRTPQVQRGLSVRTPLTCQKQESRTQQRFDPRAAMTVGRPINSSTLKRHAKHTPSSSLNNPTAARAKTVDVARLTSIRRSIQTLQQADEVKELRTTPEAKTPTSNIFRKIFASGNSGTRIPLRRSHLKDYAKEVAASPKQAPKTPVNKQLEALRKKRRSRRSSDFGVKGLDDEACLLITPSLMRRLICTARGTAAGVIRKGDNEEPVKVHSVKPSSLLKYLFNRDSSAEATNTPVKTETLVSEEASAVASNAGLFRAQTLTEQASKASVCAQVFGNTEEVSARPLSLFSAAVPVKDNTPTKPVTSRSVGVVVEELAPAEAKAQCEEEELATPLDDTVQEAEQVMERNGMLPLRQLIFCLNESNAGKGNFKYA